jgi:GT2 family glycosyltransferase
VQGDVLWRCVEATRRDAGVGVMSCKVLNADGSIQNVTRRFPSPSRVAMMLAGLPWKLPRLFGWADCEDLGWDRERTARDVDWVGGAFMMIRSEVLERLGGLDESFFFYGEDVEFCRRAWRAGWRVRYEPVGSITHLGGASSDPGRLPERARSTHAWNGRYLVQRRCYGRVAAAVVRRMDLAFARARLWRLRRRRDDPRVAPLREAIAYLTDPANRGAEGIPARTGLNLAVRAKSESADAVSIGASAAV